MRLAIVIALAVLAGSPARSGDCPTPKRLTCPQLKALVADRCEPEPAKACPTLTCPPVDCIDYFERVKCPPVTCAGSTAEQVVSSVANYCRENPIIANVYIPRDHGVPIVHVGAGYLDGPTGSVGAGWRFRNGMDLLANAVYQYQDSHAVEGYDQVMSGKCPKYIPTVYGDDSRHHWGATVDLTIPLDKHYTHRK